MIFVDTGAWFAAVVPWDANHGAASSWIRQNREPLLTTDFIVDEVLTLLRAKNETPRAIALGQHLFAGTRATLYHLTELDIQMGWRVFCQYADKEWSFTDCTSKVAMESLGISTAFTFDHHFKQFGNVWVVP